MKYKIHFPETFDEYEWEIEAKGYFEGIVLKVENRSYKLNFYDEVRLAQDISEELAKGSIFTYNNLVVIKDVNTSLITTAIEKMVELKLYEDFKPIMKE